MDDRAGLMCQAREVHDRLQHPCLVVRVHHRHQRRACADRSACFVDARPSIGIDTDPRHAAAVLLEPSAWPRSRRMLDDRRDYVTAIPARLARTPDREVARLASTTSGRIGVVALRSR